MREGLAYPKWRRADSYPRLRSAIAIDETAASFSEFNSATSDRYIKNDSVWGDLAVLTDGATIAVDMNNGYDFGGASNAALALGGK